MKRLIGACLILAGAMLLPLGGAAAKDYKLAAFFGTFKGNGVSENRDSIYFGTTVRDLDVTIQPTGKGFTVDWRTVIRRGGDPKQPKVREKAQRMTFDPAGKDGVYRAQGNGDMLSGQRYAWSYIRDNELIIHIMSIAEDGAYEMQSYTRSLVPTGMRFTFERIRNDEPVRTVKGNLVKVSR
jgi:hypothetical protein